MIEPDNKRLSISRQCKLLGVSRSGYYYKQAPVSTLNLRVMEKIDEIFMANPEYGSRKIRDVLYRQEGIKVNRKRVQRLMRLMGIEAIYPKRNLSMPGTGGEHKIYPYLLRKLRINRPNQVWCTDITYIRLSHGFVYLVAIMDWFSRKILSWELSTTMDSSFCISALERAIRKYGRPEIFNSDQGAQFTCKEFRKVLEDRKIRISMDGKGRALDNIMIERFWRTLKYGEVYLNDYSSPLDAACRIGLYMTRYNEKRPHDSLNKRTPDEVYYANETLSKVNSKVG